LLLEQRVAKGVRTTKQRFTFKASIAPEPMPAAEWQAAERLLAKLVARAIARDHPEWFQSCRTDRKESEDAGPPAAAAAVAGALPANADGPARESRESGQRTTAEGDPVPSRHRREADRATEA
jgi:hypothetical protein